MSVFEKMFGKRQTPRVQLEIQLEKFKKPEERKRPPPVIPPALKKAGKAAFEKFKETSIRVAQEQRKPGSASSDLFSAFKAASIRAYQQQGTPRMSEVISPATIRRMTPKPKTLQSTKYIKGRYSRYKKQRKRTI